MENNKFYTLETEQRNTFYQIPKQFMNTDSKYFSLNPMTKLLYGILADRNSLSVKNGWYDSEGRIYFKFNQKDLGEVLGIKDPKTIRKYLKELENFGLLYRKRIGLKQSDNLYLLQVDYEDFSSTYSAKSVENTDVSLMGKKSLSRRGKNPYQDGENSPTNNTNTNKTEKNKLSSSSKQKKLGEKGKEERLVKHFEDNICELKKTTKIKFLNFIENRSEDLVIAIINYQTEINTKSYAAFDKAVTNFSVIKTVAELHNAIDMWRKSQNTLRTSSRGSKVTKPYKKKEKATGISDCFKDTTESFRSDMNNIVEGDMNDYGEL